VPIAAHGEWPARVRAALAAAAERCPAPLVLEARCAAAERAAGERATAAACACRASDRGDAASLPSCFKAFNDARDRLAEPCRAGAPWPLAKSRDARLRVLADVLPDSGGGKSTPARLALDNPMAMACLEERAPWTPSLMW